MADVDRILIVGGGIGGLTLATALHRQGYTPELIERSTAWPAIGAGINLPANGVRVLRTLGVAIILLAGELRLLSEDPKLFPVALKCWLGFVHWAWNASPCLQFEFRVVRKVEMSRNPFCFLFGNAIFDGYVQFRVMPLKAFLRKFDF